ncbi:transporter substrate-binding domain-containing protein [Chitinimonas sp. BJB300]|uniref:transporter substrate-binding domain-containing protein n=1 Tax=Chitinimonas sp. BJB300 TaxID=1559339 RepID=UPI000C0CDD37|nr:transporter substrate-binding domain-containing protein [Chitinimonas sp. BJB300]PHV11814.1 cysteine ABC transporter substrate-binding protein [Chitinimonas sp. BJB300]TSJ87025.1 transporter substrate-binding domain-containing protein [Chitinimonas sp. BJB300]
MKHRLAVFALAYLATLLAWADDLDKILKKGEIIIGVRAGAPPFGFFDKARNKVSGYDVAFGDYVATRLGVKAVFQPLDPAERIPALQSGKIDLIVAALTKTAAREKELDFSVGYFVAVQKLAARRGRFRSLSDVNNAKICFAEGTTADQWIPDNFPKAVLVPAVGYPQAFSIWQAGGCDAVAGQATILKGNIRKLPRNAGIAVLDDLPLGMETFAMAVRKGETRLKERVNKALIDSEKNGDAVRIYEQYFGEDSAVPQLRMFKIQG